jgi:signal transduction histidine kinase
MNISQFLSASSFETTMEKQRKRIEDESETLTQRYELQMIRKGGTERTIDMVTSLLPDRERCQIIQAIARDVTEQKRAQDTLRAYASREILAQEEERKRVARELHDDTSQALASLGMDIDSLAKAKGRSSREVSERLEGLRDRTDVILRGVRSLSQALRPSMLEELGLLAALRGLTDDLVSQQGIAAQFVVQGTPRRLPPDIELALFRIAQEASSNIGKHARATECAVSVEFSPGNIKLRISDNGQGFELPAALDDYAYSGNLGLVGMQERAKLINGALTIWSQLGKGTTIVLEACE